MKLDLETMKPLRTSLAGLAILLAATVFPAIGQTAHDPAMHPYRTTTRNPSQKTTPTYKAPKLSVTPRRTNTRAIATSTGKRNGSDAQVAAIEHETAKTQTSKTIAPRKSAAVRSASPSSGVAMNAPEEKNQPINFSYQTPKNNATTGTMARPKKNH